MSDASPSERPRVVVFAILAASIAIALGVYVAIRAIRARSPRSASSAEVADAAQAQRALATRPHVLFRDLRIEPSDAFGRLGASALDAPDARLDATTPCMRVHFARAASSERRGLCFEADVAPDEHGSTAILRGLDATWTPTWSRPMNGIPSRLRASPHGKIGAATIFVTGHSYDDETMSTQTLIIDLATGEPIADLETFDIRRGDEKLGDGVNLWGVTFADDDDTFYVTVARAETTWLAKGSVSSRTLRTLRENVECPSLSPDQRTIAFKKRGVDRTDAHLFTLDLATLEDRAIPGETRVIDDQAEWLDGRTILYKYGTEVWAASITPSAPPRVFLERASSPAIVER